MAGRPNTCQKPAAVAPDLHKHIHTGIHELEHAQTETAVGLIEWSEVFIEELSFVLIDRTLIYTHRHLQSPEQISTDLFQ